MSTRSGKRIHSTAFESNDAVQPEVVSKAEKKTRNKRLKENEVQPEFAVPKSKSQKHYVAYPSTDDEGGYTTASDALDGIKSARKAKKNTLKEHDINIPVTENVDDTVEEKKNARVTRRTRKFAENAEDVTQNGDTEVPAETALNKKVKGKKNKKKNSKNNSDVNENIPEPEPVPVEEPKESKKSKKKKKKGKQANSSTEEIKQTLNKSNVSMDSFHSAAGSPINEKMDVDVSPETDKTLVKETEDPEVKSGTKTRRKSSIKPATPKQAELELELNDTLKNDAKNNRKSSLKNRTFDKEDSNASNDLNSTYDKNRVETDGKLNTSVVKEPKARRSLRLNDSIAEETDAIEVSTKLNTTFEKETESRKSLRSNNSGNGKDISSTLNTTFEKSPKKSQNRVISLDSTFDKSDPKLNTTFDKTEAKNNSEKSSLISSDEGTVNVTFDKDNSRISITSDDSKSDNIVNTTPLLIESSLDESRLSTSKSSENLNVTKEISPTQKDTLQPPVTPLKREGTFTKDSPEIKAKTPTKRLTLPSPGMTPFNVTRSSTREKSVMNVTRSIEKSRRSSLADLAPSRQTRVMFCSPVNNPAIVMQQKKKVIKSSMKGSNKSFVFDESASVAKPASRKRSYTHNDADDRRVKRTRLADDLQNSVDRLSRPRTSSAAAKLPDTTPSKKPPTPAKPKSEPKRTKLPNFAAMHQKQFARMESLDECQRRKLQRAKKMLVPKTPNGTIAVLERSSPRGTAEQAKQKDVPAKKPETPAKKPVTPAKKPEAPAKKAETTKKTEQPSKLSKLPTLESLRPGFTRFGFKMNTEFNPFSIPSKTDTKPKNLENPNGLTTKPTLAAKTPVAKTRLPPLPSMTGATTIRKEAAKQVVMREKSFTSLSGKRDMKRNENRTVIKGVRTNRRFDLQMKMRNID
ncbi:hypothetical protein NE865_12709 [Phthorimaea operculella]|nr:hypothetical protein NE865_12709 [Phthorimaea operculella]